MTLFCRNAPGAWFSRVLLAVMTLVAVLPAHGQSQSGQVVERAQLLRTQPTLRDDPTADDTGTDDSQAVASPNDPDLGEQAILKRSDNYKAWSVSVAAPFSYTSNVALTRTNEQDDVIWTPSLAVTYAPRITSTLFATFTVGQQYFFYDRFDELDFGSFDARAGLVYTLPRLRNLLLRADYSYNRLTADDGFDEFFQSHSVSLGAEIPFRIGRAQQISVGTDFSFTLDAEPEEPGRNDYSAFVGYSLSATRDLTLAAVARLAVRDYLEGDRTDVSGILALSANYRFTKWLSANAISTFATSSSNQDVFDYNVANLGLALALNFRF